MILFCWRGYGFVMPIVVIAILCVVDLLTEITTHNSEYYSHHFWPQFLGTVFATVGTYFMARLLNHWNKPRELFDMATGEDVIIMRTDSFFFIPAKAFPYVVFVIGTLGALSAMYM